MQIICTGSTGLVASHFKQYCQNQGIIFHGVDLHGEGESIDITNYDQLYNHIKKIKEGVILESASEASRHRESNPLILFHFAAITMTGKNLTPEQIDLTNRVNIDGTKNALRVCHKLKIPLVHISTDFVFSGCAKTTPYLPEDETQADDTIYSQSKKTAEDLVLATSDNQFTSVIRIAFPYGNFSHEKKGLARKMMDWMDNLPEVNLYANQQACPTPISYISKACFRISQLISNAGSQTFARLPNRLNSGQIFHVVGQTTTPYKFGSLINRIFDKRAKLNATHPKDINKNMVLDTTETEELLGFGAPSHEEELKSLKSK